MSQSGAHQSATCQKGVKSCQKGDFPNLVETAGYTLAQAFRKGVWSHPTFDRTRSPAIHSKKKTKKLGLVGRILSSTINAAEIWIWSRSDGKHGRRRRKALSPFFSSSFFFGGGVYPFLSNALFFFERTRPAASVKAALTLLPIYHLLIPRDYTYDTHGYHVWYV